jgi:hypothetical protein
MNPRESDDTKIPKYGCNDALGLWIFRRSAAAVVDPIACGTGDAEPPAWVGTPCERGRVIVCPLWLDARFAQGFVRIPLCGLRKHLTMKEMMEGQSNDRRAIMPSSTASPYGN